MLRNLNVCEQFFPLSSGGDRTLIAPNACGSRHSAVSTSAPSAIAADPPYPAGNLFATTAMNLEIGADLSVFSPGHFLLLSQKINKIP